MPAAAAEEPDYLAPLRRPERACPGAARELDEALALPVPGAARRLPGILGRRRPELVDRAAVTAVERALQRAEAVRAPGGPP